MIKFQFQLVIYTRLLIKLILLSSVVCFDGNYSINCGSNSDVTVDGRNFIGDRRKSDSFHVGQSKIKRNSSVLPADTSPLYQTARIYNKQSAYELELAASGSYIVRLHFFPFISGHTNLSDALFNISASGSDTKSGFLLFSATRPRVFQVTIKEYFLTISAGKFEIHFVPDKGSYAFINAIEAIVLPNDFGGNNVSAVPPVRAANGNFTALLSNCLQTLYRVNVGGQEVNRSDDPLRRYWSGDDQFLATGSSGINYSVGSSQNVRGQGKDIAPTVVYKTYKHLNSRHSNITWHFNVTKNVRHNIRLHFCDTLSQSPGLLKFNLYIYSSFSCLIDPSSVDWRLATAFFYDFVVESDDSGYLSITIGPDSSSETKDAFLNGLEIMQFVNKTDVKLQATHDYQNTHTNLLIGCSVGGVVLMSTLIIFFLFIVRRMRAKPIKKADIVRDETTQGRGRIQNWIAAIGDHSVSPLPNLNLKLKMSLSEIQSATRNFDVNLLIGEGGFGKVYKGTLPDGRKVAVKRSDSSHGQGLREFQTEVIVLYKIRHRHLVSLIGYCDEGSEMILVYEYMERGTLRDHLYIWKENSESQIPQLTWKQRLEICIGAAKGLHYLHTGSDWGIIHRDVKSTNILLDKNYVAKVADFGLSQSGAPDPEQYHMGLIGSFGYLDPEYIRTYQLTYKSDVYSFGVVLLEVLCARPPIINSSNREEINLAEWGMLWHRKGQLDKIVDPVLANQINSSSLRKFGEITERCLKTEGADRPAMLDVCWDLEYALQLQQTTIHREPHEDSTTDVSSNIILPSSSTHFPSGGNDVSDYGSKVFFSIKD